MLLLIQTKLTARLASPLHPLTHHYPKQNSCQAFVVNNYVGTGGLDEDAYCTLAPTPELKQGLAAFCNVRFSSLARSSRKDGAPRSMCA